jgi:hypothetical protein
MDNFQLLYKWIVAKSLLFVKKRTFEIHSENIQKVMLKRELALPLFFTLNTMSNSQFILVGGTSN